MTEIHAVTREGKEVVLQCDYTWNYKAVPEPRVAGGLPITPWGASVQYLLTALPTEPIEVDEDLESVSFEIKVQQNQFLLEYSFDENRLNSATLTCVEDEVDSEEIDLETAWTGLCFELEQAYGEPIQHKAGGWNDLDKDDFAYWNQSVGLIELRWSVYQDESTRAVAYIRGGRSFVISLQVDFMPIQP